MQFSLQCLYLRSLRFLLRQGQLYGWLSIPCPQNPLQTPKVFRCKQLQRCSHPYKALRPFQRVYRLQEIEPYQISTKALKIDRPTSPLFSGWNWHPKTLSFSTLAVRGAPYSVTAVVYSSHPTP